ncbi:hypothetical protein GCM10010297_57320 [Streptomyces malachitofuscus]|nr:hypothetical protein GCM10010297_57320 [Streptomyces malachitofuscus]
MHTRTWIAAATTVSALLTVSAAATATAADTATGSDARATSEWSVTHRDASASGLIRPLDGKSAIDGELRNTGSECYSLVTQPLLGSFPGPMTKLATLCDAGSIPVYREYAGASTLLKICRGSAAPYADCGPAQRLPSGWNPPEGYVFEASWLGTSDLAYCKSQGEKGIAEGRWTEYLCRAEYRGGADIPLLHQVLYVKK